MNSGSEHIQARRSGFTIVELMIAIAVLALISVGLAVIFGSIGDAVSQGRRASELNRAAARIESQLRDDINRMAEDGFLIVTQRYASDASNNPTAIDVRLSPREAGNGRKRRADELMFFAHGDFQTMRPALASGLAADSGEAAIYYGLGQKRPPDLQNPNDPLNFFFNPSPVDTNLRSGRARPYAALLGVVEPTGAAANPNRYARDWNLVRQVTLLSEPRVSRVLPSEVYGVNRRQQIAASPRLHLLEDSARQIALQPSARSIFNSLGWTFGGAVTGTPGTAWTDSRSRWWIGDVGRYLDDRNQPASWRSFPAWRSSGVVDVAQGSIASIRRQLEALANPTVGLWPSSYVAPGSINDPYRVLAPPFASTADGFNQAWESPVLAPSQSQAGVSISNATDSVRVRAWALDMLPSLWDGEVAQPAFLAGVRTEDLPTRLVYDDGEFSSNDAGRMGRAISEANQEMLTSQVFVPRCSEVIIEWSYGFVDTTLPPGDPAFGQMIWYGIPRATRDTDGDQDIDQVDHNADPSVKRYTQRNATEPKREQVMVNLTAGTDVLRPDFAVFGLTDDAGTPNDVSDDVRIPWPKFLRITMSIADPQDERVERTFQWVFAVPPGRG